MKAPQASLTPDKRFAIADFFERYADVVDNGRFDQWPEFFTSDCLYRVTSRENVEAGLEYGALYCQGIGMVRDRTMALRDVTVFEPRTLRHVLGSPRLEQALDGSIKARTSFVVIEVLADS